MDTNALLFGSEKIESQAADVGRLILRICAGLALALAHGWGKVPPSEGFMGMVAGLGMPGWFAYLSALAEFGGGLLLAFGLLTRPAALMILLNMTVVVLLAHADDPFSGKEKGFLFLIIAVFFLLAGAGRYAVDSIIRSKKGSGS